MGFIYKVTNKVNQKVYIGQSLLNPRLRFQEHIRDSRREEKSKRPFYRALNKYGKDNFIITTIEEVDAEMLNDREIYWIKQYRSYVGWDDCNGYNATLGGDSTHTCDYDIIVQDYEKTKSKIQTAKKLWLLC